MFSFFKRNRVKEVREPTKPRPIFCKKYLIIADTHGHLAYSDSLQILPVIEANADCDACFFLGDHDSRDLKRILSIIPPEKCYGIPGNHDNWDVYRDTGITDIHGKCIELDGVTIAGLGGSIRYKNHPTRAMLSQEEAAGVLSGLPDEHIDLLFTHSPAYSFDPEADPAHEGFRAIDAFVREKQIPYHLFGHIHKPTVACVDGCLHQSIYPAKVIRL